MKNLISDIKRNIEVNEMDLKTILSKFESRTYGKKETISSIGKIPKYMSFIEKGLVRVYFFDTDVKEITIQLGIENMWVNNLYSFLKQTPSQYHIEVLEASTIVQIHKNSLEQLFIEVPEMERFFRLKIQRAYIALQERTLMQSNKSAEDRYIEFKDKYGHIESRVPQYMIASYLNISPEHLSPVRNKLAKI